MMVYVASFFIRLMSTKQNKLEIKNHGNCTPALTIQIEYQNYNTSILNLNIFAEKMYF